jgi:hypothetical protein
VLDEAHKIKASLLRARVPCLSTGRSFAHPLQYVCGVHGFPRRALTRSSGLILACTAARCEGTVSHCGAACCSVSRHCCSLARRRRPRQSMRSAPT